MKNITHGGELDTIEKLYNIEKKDIIDFSGNINPVGITENIKNIIFNNIDIIKTYPDKDYINLKNAISEYINCSINNILVGNGATEIISIFLEILNPKNCLIVSPSYSEYETKLKNNNCNISFFELEESENFILNVNKLIKYIKSKDLVIICNPNNPTGTAVDIYDLEKIAMHCKKENAILMIDETYTEFTNFKDNISAIPLVNKLENIFIIRGTSKFFSIPGARLGYGICSNKAIIEKINTKKDPWSVNSFANLIGINLFKDKEFISKTQDLIYYERENFFKELNKIKNLKFYNSKSNFILCKILNEKNSDFIFESLLKEKMLIRNAKDFPFLNDKFFRFCILSKENNKLLLKNLKNLLK